MKGPTDDIRTREDFIQFLENLLMAYQSEGKDWENNNLEDFLSSMMAYSKDIDGYYKNTNQHLDLDNPSWKVFADILIGATIYE